MHAGAAHLHFTAICLRFKCVLQVHRARAGRELRADHCAADLPPPYPVIEQHAAFVLMTLLA